MLNNGIKHWWSRECGGKQVLAMAIPLLVSTASWAIMNFADRMFLSHYNKLAFASAMPAGMLQFTLLCFPLGIAAYVNAFVSQYHGAKQDKKIGVAVSQAVLFSLAVTPLLLLFNPFIESVFTYAGHGDKVPYETTYFQILSTCAGGAVLAGALSSFFTGIGRPSVVMGVMVFTCLLNIFLDWIMIFGNWGCPKMGIAGAAWATSISQWSRVIIYWAIMVRKENRARYGIEFVGSFNKEAMKRLLRFGVPSGVQMLYECAAFSVFILLLGSLGTDAMAASTMAFNINSVAFVPMLGMGIAVSTLVGQQLGANRPELATRATWTAYHISLFYCGMMGATYIFLPDLFMLGHGTDLDLTKGSLIHSTVTTLLKFVAAYLLFDASNIIFSSAIKGAGDTRFVLFVTLFFSPFPVLIGLSGVKYFGAGLYYCWSVLTVWIFVLGSVYFARFMQGKWKSMRVIEMELVEEISIPAAESKYGLIPNHASANLTMEDSPLAP